MSIDRQFGVHEIPGTEEPAPHVKRETVSAGFESQMREYVNAIWAKIASLETRLQEMSSSGRPLLVSDAGEARGERYGDEFGPNGPGVRAAPPKPGADKPWEAEGVSRRTWYRRHGKGAAA